MKPRMKVMLKNTNGETVSIDVNPGDTFTTLQNKLQIECGINLDLSHLAINGKKIGENDTLSSCLESEVQHETYVPASTLLEADLPGLINPSHILQCIVPGCEKYQADFPSKKFFVLPADIDRYHHWLLVCKRPDLLSSISTAQHSVCEDHFIAEHFLDDSRQMLKLEAIPTLLPFDQYSQLFEEMCSDDILEEKCEILLKEEIPECIENSPLEINNTGPFDLDGMQQLCRLCASNISDVVYIFNDTGHEQQIAMKINSCLPVTVKSTDPLPKQLCTTCVNKLNICHEFAEACIQAEEKLLALNQRRLFLSHPVLPKAPDFSVRSNTTLSDASNRTVVKEILNNSMSDTCEVDIRRDAYCCPLCCEGGMVVMEDTETVAVTSDTVIGCGNKTKCDGDKIECERDCNGLQNIGCDASGYVWDENHTENADYSVNQEGSQKGDNVCEMYVLAENEVKLNDNFVEKFICRICTSSFRTAELCLAHSATHFETDFYPCSICDLCFSSLSSFQRHSEKHIFGATKSKSKVTKRLVCNSCGKRFNTEKNLKNHSCGSSPRPFKCEECGKYFLTELRLLFHQQVHQGGSAVTCEHCGKMFSRENNLFDHVRLVHMGEKAHCCDQCGKTFQLKARLVAHQRVHSGERPFECDICGGKFYDKATLKGHHVTHLDVKPFQCEKCGRCFARKTLFKQHTLAHLSEERKQPRTYCCKLCGGTVFASYTKLIEHRKEVHPEAEMKEVDDQAQVSKPFKCDDCGKSFAYRVTLVAHRRNHTGELPFQCEFCSKRFSQKRSLHLHRRTHTGEKPFACVECGKRFVQSAHLYSHTRLHTGEKPYACEVCGDTFRLKDVRDAHQRKHTGERPFKCNVCGKAFRTSHSYYQHNWIHQGKKPYPCTYCGKAFRRSNGLKIHIRIHTGEKPHSCDVCGRSFAQKQDMKKHRNLHVIGKL